MSGKSDSGADDSPSELPLAQSCQRMTSGGGSNSSLDAAVSPPGQLSGHSAQSMGSSGSVDGVGSSGNHSCRPDGVGTSECGGGGGDDDDGLGPGFAGFGPPANDADSDADVVEREVDDVKFTIAGTTSSVGCAMPECATAASSGEHHVNAGLLAPFCYSCS